MNEQRYPKIENWLNRELARGRRAFIWRWGVLRAGVPFAVLSVLLDEVWQGEHLLSPPWLSMMVRLLVFVPVGALGFGAVLGWMMWNWLSAFELLPSPDARNGAGDLRP